MMTAAQQPASQPIGSDRIGLGWIGLDWTGLGLDTAQFSKEPAPVMPCPALPLRCPKTPALSLRASTVLVYSCMTAPRPPDPPRPRDKMPCTLSSTLLCALYVIMHPNLPTSTPFTSPQPQPQSQPQPQQSLLPSLDINPQYRHPTTQPFHPFA